MLCKVQLQSHVHGTVLVVMDRCPQRQVLPLFIVGQFSELNEAHWCTAGQFSELIFLHCWAIQCRFVQIFVDTVACVRFILSCHNKRAISLAFICCFPRVFAQPCPVTHVTFPQCICFRLVPIYISGIHFTMLNVMKWALYMQTGL